MLALLRALWKDESGQALVEYGLIVGLLAVAVIATIVIFRDRIIEVWTNMTNSLECAATDPASC